MVLQGTLLLVNAGWARSLDVCCGTISRRRSRGCVHTDRTADIDIYLRKHPGLLNLRSSTVLADDAIIADIGTENTSGPGKKAKASQRAAKAAGGKKSTKTHASTHSAPMKTTIRGRVRKSISRLAFHITPSDTQRLNSYLNELYNINTDEYERF